MTPPRASGDGRAVASGSQRSGPLSPERPVSRSERLLVDLGRWTVGADEVIAGNPTGLFALLWGSGGVWVLLAWALGGFEDGRPGLALLVGVVALVLGTVLRLQRGRRLPDVVNVAVTLLGTVAIAGVVVAGDAGAGGVAAGVLFVYVTCFAFVAVPAQAIVMVAVSSALHLGVLLWSGRGDALPVWTLTWGTAAVTGLLAGTVVQRLVSVAAELRRADEDKDQFVATVSHELRTPLTSIIGSVETLLRHEERVTPEARRELLEVVRRQAGRQQRLVEDVLLVALRAAGGAEPQREVFDLDAVVHATLESLDVEVELELAPPQRVHADPMHVQRVLDNLLVNAHRYGAAPIVLRTSTRDAWVVVEVADHGEGIPGGFEGGVLEPFVQGDAETRPASAGVGLGLTVCRDLVAANGGQLSYVDTPGGGATVRVLLPMG
jgi:signal transduction histidine kinase